jgi:hypothetical protein
VAKDRDSITVSVKREQIDEVTELERELGLPHNWYSSLLKRSGESDWSFVIKLHALFEAATAHAIHASLNRPELKEFVERLNMRGMTSKTALGQALGVLTPAHVRFLNELSRIRNDCIHDVRNVTFRFDGYIDRLEPDQRNGLLLLFDVLRDPMPIAAGESIPRNEFVRRNTRTSLWIVAYILLAKIYVEKERAEKLARGIAGMTLRDLFGSGKTAAEPSLKAEPAAPKN